MTTDAFNTWFECSIRALRKAVFQCAQWRCGATRDEAASGVLDLYIKIRSDQEFLDRIIDEPPPMMRRTDGRPGYTLFAYIVAAARNNVCRQRRRNAIIVAYVADPNSLPERASRPLLTEELADEIRCCWSGLNDEQRSVYRRKKCAGDKLAASADRSVAAAARLSLLWCLYSRGWGSERIADLEFQIQAVICGSHGADMTTCW